MPRPRKPETRTAIMSAAKNHFSEFGYHDTNVSQIIQKVGMAQGSFYTYFKNKREIFRELLLGYTQKIDQTLRSIPLDLIKDKASYILLVYKLGDSLIQIFLEDQELTRIFFWEAMGLDPEFDQMIDSTYQSLTNYCGRYIERGQALGIIRANIDSQLIAAATIGMCTHLLSRYLRGDYPGVTPEKIMETIFDLQLRGILQAKENK